MNKTASEQHLHFNKIWKNNKKYNNQKHVDFFSFINFLHTIYKHNKIQKKVLNLFIILKINKKQNLFSFQI